MNNQILTIRDVSEILKINEKTASRVSAEGKLPGFKVADSWRFRTNDIDSWIRAKLKQEAQQA